ncbi:MAG: heparinase II/III family protein [Rhodospirillales bacterium]|nr:heparinase II/III family protein [Rhodospirillales bacterium]MBO6787751.1 heparinase II/III family protein [Rhodospirillales bacterium]
MFNVMPAGMRDLVFRSRVYEWLLPSSPPQSVRVPQGIRGLGADAAWSADRLAPPPDMATPAVRDDFRHLGPAVRADDAWPGIASWISANRHWASQGWRADVLGERLTRWLAAFDIIGPGIDPAERERWATEIWRGARHLNRASLDGIPPWRRMLAHQGRINTAIALPELESGLQRRLNELGDDVDRQVLSDGGHIERAPAQALCVLAVLTEIRDALLGHHIEPPKGLISALDRMVPFIKALLHPDGGFALVGGATANTADLIDAVIKASGSKGRAMTSAPHTGFHRLRAGQTTLIADCGRTPAGSHVRHAPASFEISAGKVRLIGNCGTRLADDGARRQWMDALESTAAHTALVINDKDAGPVSDAKVERRDHEGARLIEMSHDGYAAATGIRHTRSVYLDASGSDVRGEDVLKGGSSQPFSVRFHLYPDISASMVAGGGEVIVKPPRGRGWRFTTRYPVRLEESVSFFDGRQHRSQQIVILGNHEPAATTVKWRFAIDS